MRGQSNQRSPTTQLAPLRVEDAEVGERVAEVPSGVRGDRDAARETVRSDRALTTQAPRELTEAVPDADPAIAQLIMTALTREVDLRPTAIKKTYYSASSRVVKYYENLRIVYEVQSKARAIKEVMHKFHLPCEKSAGALNVLCTRFYDG